MELLKNTNMPESRTYILLQKLLRNDCTPAEKEELFELVEQLEDEPDLQHMLEQAWMEYEQPVATLPEEKAAGVLRAILNEHQGVHALATAPVRSLRWTRIAAAAAVLLVAGVATYFLFFRQAANTELVNTRFPNDVQAPAGNRAMVTLANGSKVYLDSIGQNIPAQQGNVKLIKLASGELVYQTEDRNNSEEMVFNTLTNPRGSRVVTMQLADGSKVWLNAGSSITYPVAFTTKERRVNMQGEAYFEVKHQASRPFKVIKGNTEITVLGTHFNVSAYNEEAEERVTLLEGSVQVNNLQNKGLLKPGQQAVLAPRVDNNIEWVSDADTEEAIAWKEGSFQYSSTEVSKVLRDVARWYDIEVVYEKGWQEETVSGGIARSASLSEVLTILEMSRIKFTLEGKKLTVLKREK